VYTFTKLNETHLVVSTVLASNNTTVVKAKYQQLLDIVSLNGNKKISNRTETKQTAITALFQFG